MESEQARAAESLQAELSTQIRELKAHNEALSDSLEQTNRENVQLKAQVIAVRSSAEDHLGRMKALLDSMYQRINVMVDTWQVQIRTRFKGTKGEKEKLIADVEPFRPR